MTLSLQDGYGPSSANFTVRLPMGVTAMTFEYGADDPLALNVEVPERILEVDRDLWECYADRSQDLAKNPDPFMYGCGGWGQATVEKWLNDVPVKVWATGHPDYIAVLETILSELSPILNLEFEWVDAEEDADFKAFVGVSRSEADSLGVSDPFYASEAWGFASANVNRGEATSGRMVIWHTEEAAFKSPIDSIRSVTIHEALHALVPMSHSTRPVSIMGGSSLNTLSSRDAQLIRLNSHTLVRPGMTMSEVRELVVISDELLDYDPSPAWDDPMDLVWRAYVALEEAGSASFRLTGGECRHTFGAKRGPIEMAIGNFRQFKSDPALLHLNIHPRQFYVAYSRTEQEWTHWQLSPEGAWEKVDRETIWYATSWWLWNGKLHAAIRSLLMDGSSEDISVDETADGTCVSRLP